MTTLALVSSFLDETLRHSEIPDYDRALNGLQLGNAGDLHRVAAAVDCSLETVRQAIAARADLLIVHHGMFWSGLQPLVDVSYERLRLAMANDLAVYSSHLPLDYHQELGNNVLLARRLDLALDSRFGRYQSLELGVSGPADLPTAELEARIRAFAEPLGTRVVGTPHTTDRRTRRWAILTGAGASTETLREAATRNVDTLIVGEGPHHTAVDAQERGMVVIYAGHYATETLGVQAVAAELERTFGLPWTFLHAPTGL